MTTYSLDVLLSQFGTSLFFLIRFWLLLLDLHTDFSGDRSGGLVFPSLLEFSTVYCDQHSQGLGIVNKSEVDIFLELCWFFSDQRMLAIWPLVLLPFLIQLEHLEVNSSCIAEAWLGEFEHYFASVWDECNCAVVWALFGIAFLWDWNKNWTFPVPWPLLSFSNLLAYWVQHFHSIIF